MSDDVININIEDIEDILLMTVVFITFVNSLEKLLWTFWVPTRGQVSIYLNLLTKRIHIHTYLNSENCHLFI